MGSDWGMGAVCQKNRKIRLNMEMPGKSFQKSSQTSEIPSIAADIIDCSRALGPDGGMSAMCQEN